MTTPARRHIRRIIAAECARAIVARCAVVSRSGMFLRAYRRHLRTLLSIAEDRMAIGAVQPLGGAVVAMAKDSLEDVSTRRRAPIGCQVVTHVTRTDLAFSCVARITRRVGPNADRYRFPGAGRFMTSCASFGRPAFAGNMRRMDEFHIEAFIKLFRKLL